MTIDNLLGRLQNVRRTSRGWSAKCPAHADKSPSLTIAEGNRGILLRCWAGCTLAEICAALGIHMRDLFSDARLPRGKRPDAKPLCLDLDKIAFKFELGALDRRRRAVRVLAAASGVTADFSDGDRDRLMDAVASAYQDLAQAETLETVADDLRTSACIRRRCDAA